MFNDEAVYTDALDHYDYARSVGDHIRECKPPYVIGVAGSWGSGKTSFLKKVWLYLGGEPDDAEAKGRREDWFGALPNSRNLELIWFNPWQHQFEASPVVALLHEIRRHFTVTRQFFDKAGKIANVAAYSALTMLDDLSRSSPVPAPKLPVKDAMERASSYEAERFSTPLTSQRFREFFEAAIKQVLGKKDRLVIFVDDLDRCEGDSAYRLLESLKLYLNAANCVYVLGIDQKHLEESVSRVLSKDEDTRRYRPAAREYLSKMFQCQFLLPVPGTVARLVHETLDVAQGGPLAVILKTRCGSVTFDFTKLTKTLDQCLPHNPRKVKSFIAAWKLYMSLLPAQQPAPAVIDWRFTLILNYLAQFEEPLYRKVEESPGFYSDRVVAFCSDPKKVLPDPLFDGLEVPDDVRIEIENATGATSSSPPSKSSDEKPSPVPRVFWISRLIREHSAEVGQALTPDFVRAHLLRAGLAVM